MIFFSSLPICYDFFLQFFFYFFCCFVFFFFFFSSRRRHTRFDCDWSSDVCSSDLPRLGARRRRGLAPVHAGRRARVRGLLRRGLGPDARRHPLVGDLPADPHLPAARRRRGALRARPPPGAPRSGRPPGPHRTRRTLPASKHERARMNWLGLPESASTHGADNDRILVLVHLLMIVMFVGWGALFVYMLVRFWRSRHPVATYGGLSSKAPKAAEWAVLVSEIVLLA